MEGDQMKTSSVLLNLGCTLAHRVKEERTTVSGLNFISISGILSQTNFTNQPCSSSVTPGHPSNSASGYRYLHQKQ